MPVVGVNGVELYYEEFGDGDEVVVSAQAFFPPEGSPYLLALTRPPANCRVFAVTLRGYGKSTHVFEDLGENWYPTWAEDVYWFARALGLGRFVYPGVSHGAGVGWHLAASHPEVLKAFVSVVGAPHPRERVGGVTSEPMRRLNESVRNPDALKGGPHVYLVPTSDPRRLERRKAAAEEYARHVASMAPEERAIHPGVIFPQAKTDEALAATLRGIRVPTLLLCGAQDELATAEASLLAAKSVPGAKAVFFQDHSHTLASEAPERLAAEVALFLRELNEERVNDG